MKNSETYNLHLRCPMFPKFILLRSMKVTQMLDNDRSIIGTVAITIDITLKPTLLISVQEVKVIVNGQIMMKNSINKTIQRTHAPALQPFIRQQRLSLYLLIYVAVHKLQVHGIQFVKTTYVSSFFSSENQITLKQTNLKKTAQVTNIRIIGKYRYSLMTLVPNTLPSPNSSSSVTPSIISSSSSCLLLSFIDVSS